jgi:hypothetical protein
MPDKKMLMIVAVTAIVVLVMAPRLRQLPGVNKLPTV